MQIGSRCCPSLRSFCLESDFLENMKRFKHKLLIIITKINPVIYLEAKDDCPDETKRQSRASVNNIVGADILQVDPLVTQKLECFFHILQTVDPHFPFGRARLFKTRRVINER